MADFKGSKRTPTFSECEREGLYKAIFLRRDIRSHFVSNKTISDDVLFKIINAAHHAPSVGFSQLWNFILISVGVIFTGAQEISFDVGYGNKQTGEVRLAET